MPKKIHSGSVVELLRLKLAVLRETELVRIWLKLTIQKLN
jgi:hypothetical protein